MTIRSYLSQERRFMGNLSETGSHKTNSLSCVRPDKDGSTRLKKRNQRESDSFLLCCSFISMFYELKILGRLRLISDSAEWNVFSLSAAPPCVKDKLADIVERTNRACRSCPVQCLFWRTWLVPIQPCYLTPGGWVHVCALFYVCVFTKSQGVTEQIARGATHIGPFPANHSRRRNSVAPFCIYLPRSQPSGRSPPPCCILSTE